MGYRRSSVLKQKNNVEWFLLRQFVNLFRVFYLHIISRNHSNAPENKNLSKVKPCRKGYLFYKDFDSVDRFLSTTWCLV